MNHADMTEIATVDGILLLTMAATSFLGLAQGTGNARESFAGAVPALFQGVGGTVTVVMLLAFPVAFTWLGDAIANDPGHRNLAGAIKGMTNIVIGMEGLAALAYGFSKGQRAGWRRSGMSGQAYRTSRER